MIKFQSRSWVLAIVGYVLLVTVGCGKPANTVVKPDMSAEDLQAQIERNAAAANAGSEE